jgi:hypothetical protein
MARLIRIAHPALGRLPLRTSTTFLVEVDGDVKGKIQVKCCSGRVGSQTPGVIRLAQS